jgi:hypothetical protein
MNRSKLLFTKKMTNTKTVPVIKETPVSIPDFVINTPKQESINYNIKLIPIEEYPKKNT